MQIVYYLGAGASANAIPTINGIRNRINDLQVYLSKYLKENLNTSTFKELNTTLKENQNLLFTIIQELKWLYEQTEHHQTVDTFAKKLFLQESNDLKKLKRALITYFYFEQSIKYNWTNIKIPGFNGYENLLDLRYDSLLANIIHRNNGKLEFEDNINIITWNYDLQIDIAIKNYFDISINEIKQSLGIHPNRNSYNLPNGDLIQKEKFHVIKLNGNAFLDNGLQNSSISTIYDKSINEKDTERIIALYLNELRKEFGEDLKLTNSAAFKYFNFAWESHDNFGSSYIGRGNVIASAKKIIDSADVLIVIGYSFPSFNFEIDKFLLNNVRLKQLIIQDENPDNIKERMTPLLKQLKLPNHNDNPNLTYTPVRISQYFPILKY